LCGWARWPGWPFRKIVDRQSTNSQVWHKVVVRRLLEHLSANNDRETRWEDEQA